ncbi:unnamed protein product [Symbiodinium sp. KB8]|nr:unnamed protein product [Symbiodinium sp. KB8]
MVTVQQYGRWYTAMLILFEFNKIGDISTALSLGVRTPVNLAFFILAMISVVHVQTTFYWLVGTRAESVVVDLYRGFGDMLVDTPMLAIELFTIATGRLKDGNRAIFIFAMVLKGLSAAAHVWGLKADLQLFAQERAQRKLAALRARVAGRLSLGFRRVATLQKGISAFSSGKTVHGGTSTPSQVTDDSPA